MSTSTRRPTTAAEIHFNDTLTLLYTAKSPDHNHALILQRYLEDYL